MTTHPFGGDSPLSSRLWGQAQPVPYTTRDCYQGGGKPSPYPRRCMIMIPRPGQGQAQPVPYTTHDHHPYYEA